MVLYRLYLHQSVTVASSLAAELPGERDALVWAQVVGEGFGWELWDYGIAPAREVSTLSHTCRRIYSDG